MGHFDFHTFIFKVKCAYSPLFSIFLPPQSEDFLIQKLNFLLDMIFLYWKLVSIEDKYYEFIYIKFLMAYRVLL